MVAFGGLFRKWLRPPGWMGSPLASDSPYKDDSWEPPSIRALPETTATTTESRRVTIHGGFLEQNKGWVAVAERSGDLESAFLPIGTNSYDWAMFLAGRVNTPGPGGFRNLSRIGVIGRIREERDQKLRTLAEEALQGNAEERDAQQKEAEARIARLNQNQPKPRPAPKVTFLEKSAVWLRLPQVVDISVRSADPRVGNIALRVRKDFHSVLPAIEVTVPVLKALLHEAEFALNRAPEEQIVATPPRRQRRRAASAQSPGDNTPASAGAAPTAVTKSITWREERSAWIAKWRDGTTGKARYHTFPVSDLTSKSDAKDAALAHVARFHSPAPRKMRKRTRTPTSSTPTRSRKKKVSGAASRS